MHSHRYLATLIVTAALLTPGLAQIAAAQERAAVKVGPVTVRVYDRTHKDYHVWDDKEDQTYRKYLGDQHLKYRPISKLSQKDQAKYWNSRHGDERR